MYIAESLNIWSWHI